MINTIYQLIAPRRFETSFEELNLKSDKVLIRPQYLSICNADQRYYQGLRSPQIMKEKLPMALIHEGVGTVLYDPFGEYKSGDYIIMIPNEPYQQDDIITGNYLRTSKFRGSSIDGFLQESLLLNRSRLVKINSEVDMKVASFTEFVSVSLHAIRRLERKSHARRDIIGVWGDGNLGYVTALLLKYLMPDSKILVVGVNDFKLDKFTFADEVILSDELGTSVAVDHAFECVGGNYAQTAINQMIDRINPEGSIAILGVSEFEVPLNTRMILEKGLTIFGNSRCEREDFLEVINLYDKQPEIVLYLSNIVNQCIDIRSIRDIEFAFESDIRKEYGKTIMKWNI